jgi:hypothetical protein
MDLRERLYGLKHPIDYPQAAFLSGNALLLGVVAWFAIDVCTTPLRAIGLAFVASFAVLFPLEVWRIRRWPDAAREAGAEPTLAFASRFAFVQVAISVAAMGTVVSLVWPR